MSSTRCYVDTMRWMSSAVVGLALLGLGGVAQAAPATKLAQPNKSVSRAPAGVQIVDGGTVKANRQRPLAAIDIQRRRLRSPVDAMNRRFVARIGSSVYGPPL